MKKIFVSAYACEPGKGSEIGVGWHWVLAMSERFELWVMTRESNREVIEPWIKENPKYSGIHFVYFDLPKKYTKWKKGMKGVRRYYYMWQKRSNRLVEKIMKENNIHNYHLLTYGNALWPASSYGMKQNFVWGPVGGLETVPAEYVKDYSIKVRMLERFRRIAVEITKLNYSFRKRCKNAALILCKSENVKQNIPRKYRAKAIVFTDVAAEEHSEYPAKNHNVVRFFAAGRLDGWRGFNLMLCAFRGAIKQNKDISLEIAGEGIAYKDLKRIVDETGGKVQLLGQISSEEYLNQMHNCDVVINPCLREGGVTTAFDAISMGKPLICIDTKGYTKNFSEGSAIVIDRTSRKEIEEKMTEAILKLAEQEQRIQIGGRAYQSSKKLLWKEKNQRICELMEKMI